MKRKEYYLPHKLSTIKTKNLILDVEKGQRGEGTVRFLTYHKHLSLYKFGCEFIAFRCK